MQRWTKNNFLKQAGEKRALLQSKPGLNSSLLCQTEKIKFFIN